MRDEQSRPRNKIRCCDTHIMLVLATSASRRQYWSQCHRVTVGVLTCKPEGYRRGIDLQTRVWPALSREQWARSKRRTPWDQSLDLARLRQYQAGTLHPQVAASCLASTLTKAFWILPFCERKFARGRLPPKTQGSNLSCSGQIFLVPLLVFSLPGVLSLEGGFTYRLTGDPR